MVWELFYFKLFLPEEKSQMHQVLEKIKELFSSISTSAITGIDKLPQAGSERHYYRIHTNEKSFIATHGANLKENETFIYFSKHFREKNLAVPEILCIYKKILVMSRF